MAVEKLQTVDFFSETSEDVRMDKIKGQTMLVVDTQYMENYGAHDWDGIGECPQYWKVKGGAAIKIIGAPTHMDPSEIARKCGIGHSTFASKEFPIMFHWESEDWLSPFERDQLQNDGEILYPEVVIDFDDVMIAGV